MAQAPPLLELRNVCRGFGSPDGRNSSTVLLDVCLVLQAGECLAVTGPSGSGKSTLLNIIGTLDRPTSGTVLLDGRDVAELDDAGRTAMRAREFGFVFQLHHLLPQCTVLENVLVPVGACRGSRFRDAVPRAMALLRRVGLEDRRDYRPAQLSVGQCQRVALVRALINSPRLLLADEPTGSLDRPAAEVLGELLAELNAADRLAMIVVTHSEALAARMARRLALRDGRLVEIP